MIIDLIFAVIVILAIFKGYRRGLIIGIFSFVAVIIGLAAAVKLSVIVAHLLSDSVNISQRWLPVISFILVFIVVVLLVRLGANLIQRSLEVAMLGWLNRLGGIVFYLAIYIAVFSVLLFYAEKVRLISEDAMTKSATYYFLSPIGPRAINFLGVLVPFFQNMFQELTKFFEGISHKMK